MREIIENTIIAIVAIWIIASIIDFVVCGQLTWHTSVELQEWNIGLIVYNWIR